jgi:hypothetical protein
LAFDWPVATRIERNMSLTSWPINHGVADVGTSVDDEVWRASHLRREQHLAAE